MPRLTQDQWKSAEEDIRAGRGSLRNIAARHGVTEGALRKRCAKLGIKPDLVKEVDAAVERRLLAPGVGEVRAGESTQVRKVRSGKARTDAEIVEDAAAEREVVVRQHRQDIARAGQSVRTLMEQLGVVAENRNLIEALVLANTDPKATQVRTAMLKAVSLPSHAGVARDLSTAMKNLVALQRQAFSIGEKESDGGIESFLKKLEEV